METVECSASKKVHDEIKAGDDELSDWADAHAEPVPQSITRYSCRPRRGCGLGGRDKKYRATAIDTFLQGADYYLTAEAVAGDHDVVTHEIPSNSVSRIKIPNVCIGLGVKCLTPFEMLNVERARFVLEPDR